MNLKRNIGFVDQLFRALLILDLIMPCVVGFATGVVAYLMVVVAALLLFSCATAYCWVYDTLDVTTLQ